MQFSKLLPFVLFITLFFIFKKKCKIHQYIWELGPIFRWTFISRIGVNLDILTIFR